jgi:hypothetical protein
VANVSSAGTLLASGGGDHHRRETIRLAGLMEHRAGNAIIPD